MPFDTAAAQTTETTRDPNLQLLLYKISTTGYLEDYGNEHGEDLNSLKSDAASFILSIMKESRDASIRDVAALYENKSVLCDDDFKTIFNTYHTAGKPAVSNPLAQALEAATKSQGGGR